MVLATAIGLATSAGFYLLGVYGVIHYYAGVWAALVILAASLGVALWDGLGKNVFGCSKKQRLCYSICLTVVTFLLGVALIAFVPLKPINDQIAASPKFNITIEKIYTHMLPLIEMKTLGTNLILVVSIENSGAESFAKWQPLTIITSDGRSLTGVLKATSNDTQSTINIGGNIHMTWWGTDALYNKTVRNPMKRGARDWHIRICGGGTGGRTSSCGH